MFKAINWIMLIERHTQKEEKPKNQKIKQNCDKDFSKLRLIYKKKKRKKN